MRFSLEVLFAACLLAGVVTLPAFSTSNADADGELPFKTVTETPLLDNETSGPPHNSTSRDAYYRSFSDLVPRQKVMGLTSAIALLRTKISLLEEMRTAFEPQSGGTSKSPQLGHSLPGPGLAYGDCRLGILDFKVCRHLGFLDSDPVVAPSSLQSKMLPLVGASAVINSLKRGTLNLQEDTETNQNMDADLTKAAARALNACWNAQLLLPAFDMRPLDSKLMKEAKDRADAFLLQSALSSKSPPLSYEEVAASIALLFSELPLSDTIPLPSDGDHATTPRNEPQRADEESSHRDLAANPRSNGGLFDGFLNTLFPRPQSETPADAEQPAPLTTALTTLTNSAGELTSMVSNAAQNAARMVTGDTSFEDSEEASELQGTEKRIGAILNMLPEEVNGQF